MKFSEKLQNLRKDNKLSQEKLADMLDVSRQAVSKWESGQTYPEMDKLLSMCKIFGCSLDELTNDEVIEIGKNNKNKNTTSNLVDEMLEIINRTCKVFRKIHFKDVIKILFEMFIIFIILLMFNIPIQYIYSLGREMFMNFGELGSIFSSIFKFILGVSYFVLAIIVFVYVYKIRVLDHYEQKYADNLGDKKLIVTKGSDHDEIPIKQEIIIKKEHNYTIFKTLGSIVMVGIKFFVLCMSLPFIFTLLFLFAALVLSIIVIFKGVFYFGIILGILSCILLNVLILEISFNFIFNKRNQIKRLFITFIVSIASLGIAVGLTMWDVTTIKYIESSPSDLEKDTYEEIYPMYNNTVFIDYYFDNVNYKIDDSMGDVVKLEISYYKNYTNVLTTYADNKYLNIHQSNISTSFKDTINILLKDLSKKQIHLYNNLYSLDITIYTNSKNQKILFDNSEKAMKEIEENENNEQIRYYQKMIDNYELEIERLKEEYISKIDKLETENQNLIDKNQELEVKINEYKLRIQEYRDSIDGLLEN